MIGITNGNGGSAGAANNIVRKNLLDNWYFVGGGSQQGGSQLPINQRGLTSYSVNGYTIDRWRTNFSNDTVTVESTSVKCLNASTSVGWHLHQIISDMDELIGATVTASFFVVGVQGTHLKPIISFRNSSDTEISSINLTSNPTTGVTSLTGVVPANTSKIRVGFYASSGIASGDYIQVSAVKFEVGGTQTLAHYDSANSVWVLNEVPNYQEQLFRCQTSTADSADTFANKENLVGFQVRPNLIDNWYFAGGGSQQGEGYLPINQRGQTSYSGAIAYTIDRWKTSNTNTTITVSSAGLTFSAVTGTTPYLLQPLGNIEKLHGKTVTASFLIGDQLYSKTDVFPVNDPSDISAICGISQVGQILYMSGAWFMRLIGSIASSNPYIAVKLELGDTQTLAHKENGVWVVNEIPDFQEELYRCKMSTADTSDTYANNKNGFLPMSGGRLTGRLYTDSGITMPTGFTSNGQGTIDLTANTYTAGANGHVLAAKFKSEDGSQTHTTYPISIIGTNNTTSNYNSGVRLGSINGTTIVSAGESGSTFAAANAKFDDENLYLVADNQVLLYKAANDGTVSLGPLVVAGFGATPTSGQVVVTSGTAGDIRSSGYAVNSSGGIPSYQYSTTDLTAGTSSLTTGRLYFVYE